MWKTQPASTRSSAAQARRAAGVLAVGAQVAPAPVGLARIATAGARRRRSRRWTRPGARDVHDAPARVAQPPLPHVLVEPVAERRGRTGRRARRRCGRSPCSRPRRARSRDPEARVEGRDRRLPRGRTCAAASPRAAAGSARRRRGAAGCGAGPRPARAASPAGASTSSSTKTRKSELGGGDAGVARGVQPGHALALDVADPRMPVRRAASSSTSRVAAEGPSSTTSTS